MTNTIPVQIQLRLHPRETVLPSNKKFEQDTSFPCYYKVGTYAYNGTRYKSVLYEIYYPANIAVGLNGIKPENQSLGYHPFDTERIITLHDISTNEPKFIFTSGHAQEGRWWKFSDCKIDNNRAVVYSALGSHRHSLKPKIHWRMFGFANDYTSDRGQHINMRMVEDNTIQYKAVNKEVLDSAFRAFFLPFYVKSIPQMKKKQAKKEADINRDV